MATQVVYTGNGSTTQFDLTFPYTDQSEVQALINRVNTAYTWVSSSRIQFASAPASGAEVRIRRVTDISEPAVDYEDGAVVTAAQLDASNAQTLNRLQEISDAFDELDERAVKVPAGASGPALPSVVGQDNKLVAVEDGALVLQDNFNLNAEEAAEAAIAAALDAEVSLDAVNAYLATFSQSTWTPAALFAGGVPGVFWDVQNGANVYRDIARTQLAALNGPVGSVTDLSGNGNHWTAYDNSTRGTYREGPDGKRYVEFDGVDDWARSPVFTAIPQPWTRVSIIRQIGWTSSERIFDGETSGSASLFQQSTSPNLSTAAPTIAILNGDRPIGVDSLIEEFLNGASSFISQDNYTTVVANAGTNSITQWRIGGRASSSTASDLLANFRFYAGFLIGGALSGVNRLLVRQWAAGRRSYLTTPKMIQCLGDSLTAGTGATAPATTSYPGRLAARLGSAYATERRGVPSDQSSGIASRMDAVPITVTLAGNGIPASGGVGVTINSPLSTVGSQPTSGPLAYRTNAGLPVTIQANNGQIIDGILSVGGTGGVYTFTRTAPGVPLEVSPGATLRVLQNYRDFDYHIFWAGRNNITDPTLIPHIASMVARLKGGAKYIVVGLTTSRDGTEDTGSTNHTAMLARNATLASTYGTRFVNPYDWLRNTSGNPALSAFAALSLTPTAQDLIDIAAGRIPQTFLSADNLHFNDVGYDAIALLIYNKMIALGD